MNRKDIIKIIKSLPKDIWIGNKNWLPSLLRYVSNNEHEEFIDSIIKKWGLNLPYVKMIRKIKRGVKLLDKQDKKWTKMSDKVDKKNAEENRKNN